MAKKANPAPSRTCADCFHFCACHLWAVSISTDVAPKCPQFEPARYASLADLHEMHQMAKGELVPVVHGRWEDDHMDYKCSSCGTAFQDEMFWIQGDFIAPNYCPNCGAKMDGGAESV